MRRGYHELTSFLKIVSNIKVCRLCKQMNMAIYIPINYIVRQLIKHFIITVMQASWAIQIIHVFETHHQQIISMLIFRHSVSLLCKLKNQQHISDDQIIFYTIFSPGSPILCILHLLCHEIFTDFCTYFYFFSGDSCFPLSV